MLIGALFDIYGVDNSQMRNLNNFREKITGLKIRKTKKNGITGTRIVIKNADPHAHRGLTEIKKTINTFKLSKDIEKKIIDTYELIFNAESQIHGEDVSKIKLHELSSLNTLYEISFYHLLTQGKKIFARNISVGSGILKSGHGRIPIPSPATSEILKNVPLRFTETRNEMVTPTAAALLKVSASFSVPEIKIKKIGYGIGKRSILRVFDAVPVLDEKEIQIEFNIDDMTSEDIADLTIKLKKYCKEIFVTPVVMKKSRAGFMLTIIALSDKLEVLSDNIFDISTTAGFRYWLIDRKKLKKSIKRIKTSFGYCRIKEYSSDRNMKKIKPEYDDLQKLSFKTGLNITRLRSEIVKEYLDE